MKIVTCWICFFLLPLSLRSQSLDSVQKTDAFIKVWGLLKYYHPTVCAGSLNWDSVFVAQLPRVTSAAHADEFNQHLGRWIRSLGDISSRPELSTTYDPKINANQPHDWLESTAALSPATVALLSEVIRHRHTGPNHYVKIESPGIAVVQHELPFAEMAYPTESYRLLALARYWNIIAYFFPYRYLTDQPWNEVLPAMIPRFRDAASATVYLRSLRRLTASVNDSHSRMINNPHRVKVLEEANFFLPIRATVIDQKLVVTGFRHPATAQSLGLQIGDAILTIDEEPVSALIDRFAPLLGASNRAVIRRDIGEYLIWRAKDSTVLTFERGQQPQNRVIRLSSPREFRDEGIPVPDRPAYSVLNNDVGYINIARLETDQTGKICRRLKKTRSLIIDLRAYPKSFESYQNLCHCLSTQSMPFVQFRYPDLSYPGTFRASLGYCGTNRKQPPYAGQIVLLVNEYTQSRGEFFAMAFQTLPNTTVLGSQTAGADGNVTTIPLPGGYQVLMTGSGVYYPDGRPTQRIGIGSNRVSSPTPDGIRQGKDELLEYAIQHISQSNH